LKLNPQLFAAQFKAKAKTLRFNHTIPVNGLGKLNQLAINIVQHQNVFHSFGFNGEIVNPTGI
jgi:hypothetical protein